MNEQLTCLGMRLKELRRKRLLTLQQLAERTELTAGLLSKIENFRTIPSLPVLLSIAVRWKWIFPCCLKESHSNSGSRGR